MIVPKVRQYIGAATLQNKPVKRPAQANTAHPWKQAEKVRPPWERPILSQNDHGESIDQKSRQHGEECQ